MNYDDENIHERIARILPYLQSVVNGQSNLSWRYTHFVQGGTPRANLAQKVSRGPYSLNEFILILHILRSIFVPDAPQLVTTTQTVSIASGSRFEQYSTDMQLRFVGDVLLAETIIQFIMQDQNITYQKAESEMLDNEKYDDDWVNALMTRRQICLFGKENLNEKRNRK